MAATTVTILDGRHAYRPQPVKVQALFPYPQTEMVTVPESESAMRRGA